MLLRELLASLHFYQFEGNMDIEITGIETDSRKVKQGYLFIATKGFTVDSHDFIPQAVEKGAVAVLCEKPQKGLPACIVVQDTKRALAMLADKFYDHPSAKLRLIGVTGTNGKTTVTHLIEKILTDFHFPTGIVGTIQMRIGDHTQPVKNTTPDVLELQRMFSYMLEKNATHVCIEVSSHALELGRVWGCEFKTAIFTNLTQDHLDYHKTMENYRFAKSLLFSQLGNSYNRENAKYAILNKDDPAFSFYQSVTAADVITYGIDCAADVRASDIVIKETGTSFTLQAFQENIAIQLKMVGKFSVYNALAAITACLVEGVPLHSIKASLEAVNGVLGRFERVDAGQDFTVIVDYAHTPDSLENVLKTAKEFVTGRIFCIIGCGGDRDRRKRPIMAQIAVQNANLAIFTSDNPRSEDPIAIIEEMVAGINEKYTNYISFVSRKQAIEYAISLARKGDCVLIAGKGHETYQIVKDQVLPFNDKEAAFVAIQQRIK